MFEFKTNFKMVPAKGPLIHDTETYTAAFKDLGGSYKVDIMRGRTITVLGDHIEGVLAAVPDSAVIGRDELISVMVDVFDNISKDWYGEVIPTKTIRKHILKKLGLPEEEDTTPWITP